MNNNYHPSSLTRVTDYRAQWREEYESHIRNKAEAAASEYYKEHSEKIDYNCGMLWQAIAFAVFLFISIYIVATYLNSQH